LGLIGPQRAPVIHLSRRWWLFATNGMLCRPVGFGLGNAFATHVAFSAAIFFDRA